MPLFGLGRKKSGPPSAPAHPARGRRAGASPQPRILLQDGDGELTRLLYVARTRDWNALRGEFAKLQGYDLSSLLSNVCAETPEIGEWVPDDAGDALAQAVLGADAIERGWRVRTSKRAQHVSQEQFDEFHRILRIAEEHLYRSAELDGSSVAPWYSLLISGRGLQVGLDAQQRRFEAVLTRCPGHLGAHRQMLQQLCRKWSGSNEQIHAFAAEAMRGPHGGVLGELIPWAYYEHCADVPTVSDELDLMRAEHSRAELREAAQRTIFRAGYSCPRSPYLAANIFMWAFSRAEMWPEAKAALDATEGVAVNWDRSPDPLKVYSELRVAVLKHS